MADNGRGDKKFTHLLQPIRSLSDNWDIDIATELEEYLDDLDELTFSFEGGPTLNFAEAALVIQGSACVYSRKVEYLHGLVYQALEVIADNKRRRTRAKGGAQGDDCDYGDDEADFLCLDNLLEVASRIDLDEDSSKPPSSAVLPPPSLLALEDASSNTDRHGDESGNFKISHCFVHSSGALLLEQPDGAAMHDDESLVSAAFDKLASPGSQNAFSFHNDVATEPADDFHDDGDDGYGIPDDEGEAMQQAGDLAAHTAQGDEGPLNPFSVDATGAGTAAEPSGEQVMDGRPLDYEEDYEEVFDPYEPLDMYDTSGERSRPFRRLRIRAKPLADVAAGQQDDGSWFTVPKAAVTGCTHPEFEYIAEASRAALSRSQHTARSRNDHPASCFTAAEAQQNGWEEAVDNADDNMGFGDFGDDYDDGAGVDHLDGQLDPLDEIAKDGNHGGMLGDSIDLDAAHIQCLSYEELCKAHIDAFIAKAAAAEVQTELASRVSSWQSKIEPALEVQSTQGAFDIHDYGERLLGNLEAASGGSKVALGFEAAVVGTETYQVSRTFSAMLQLINNGNVLIHRGDAAVCEGFHLELVTTALAHKQMGISGSLGFQCNSASLLAAGAGRAATVPSEGAENIDANVQLLPDDGRSPAPKAARTATGRGGRAKAVQQ